MINFHSIKDNLVQIFAITEKNLKLELRFKIKILMSFFIPFIGVIMPIIIMDKFFESNTEFGPWDSTNFLIFQFLAYAIVLTQRSLSYYPSHLNIEKYWQTLTALIIAPFNRFNLLLGIFFTRVILMIFPLTFCLILCYLYYPISIITLLFVIVIIILFTLNFSGIGLILGIYTISRENISPILAFLLNLVFWTSCISYPFQIFPDFIQFFINLNPFYYIFDFLRLVWIEDNIILSITSKPLSLFVIISFAITFPCVGVYFFNIVYKKYGIVGY